jgi:RecA-family ATPase
MWTIESGESLQTADTRRKPTSWLWPGYLPRGVLVVLDGDPGTAKSLLTLDWAARVTHGSAWPNGAEACPPANVVLLSAEDDRKMTIVPRLAAAGADLSRVRVLAATDSGPDNPMLSHDLREIKDAIAMEKPALVVFDPAMAFLPLTSDARRVTTALVRLAATHETSIVLVRHLTKDPKSKALYFGQGTVGIVGAARVGLLVADYPADPRRRVLTITKTNLSAPPPSLTYQVVAKDESAVIEWLAPSAITADVAVRRAERPGALAAVNWLMDTLAGGELSATDVLDKARAAGFAERTLYRAKTVLGVKSRQADRDGRRFWMWSLA